MRSAVDRRALLAIAFLLSLVVLAAGSAGAAGPGGWGHVGDGGSPGTDSLNGTASALNSDKPDELLVGGAFTDAGGEANADRIASWNGTDWSAVSSGSSQISNGSVDAIAYAGGKIYAGGTFTDAGGVPEADHLAVWDGTAWAPPCVDTTAGSAFGGNVNALEVIGGTLWVGGSFQNGAHIPSADYLLACDLATGSATSPFVADGDGSGAIYALAADSGGVLYAAGTFVNLAGLPAADYVAGFAGGNWSALGAGAPNGGAVNGITRSLATNGTDLYIGSDAVDVSGIAQADHVARWNGSAWSAVGAGSGGSDGYFSTTTFIYGLTHDGARLYATGSFQNANGDPVADNVAGFDGSSWSTVGSDGAGNGPLNANGLALASFGRSLYVAGGFTAAGGDPDARGIACYGLCGPEPKPVHTGAYLVCAPEAVDIGDSSTCTAAMFDGNVVLPSTTPTGSVSFTSDAPGTFGGGASCTLGPRSGDPRTGICAVDYSPTSPGSHRITVTYGGDGYHPAAQGTALVVSSFSNAFRAAGRGECTKDCRAIVVRATFGAAGKVVAQGATNGGAAGRATPQRRAAAMIKKLKKSVKPGVNKLKLKLTSRAREVLSGKGKLKLKVRFTYTPAGGTPGSQVETFKVKAE